MLDKAWAELKPWHLGFACYIPLLWAFRRISLPLPQALGALVSPALCITCLCAGMAVGLVGAGGAALVGRAATQTRYARLGLVGGTVGLVAMATAVLPESTGAVFSLPFPSAWLVVAGYGCIGFTLATYLLGWLNALRGVSAPVVLCLTAVCILLGNLSQIPMHTVSNPLTLNALLIIFNVVCGVSLLHARPADARPAETVESKERPDIVSVLRQSCSSAGFGLMLCCFAWGVIALPPARYIDDFTVTGLLTFFLGDLVGLLVIAWAARQLGSRATYEEARQRMFFLLPIFAVAMVCFAFARMLDASGFLRGFLSVCYNVGLIGFGSLFIATTALRCREKLLSTGLATAPFVLACVLVYVAGAVAYALLGNNAMYLEVMLVLAYMLCLMGITARRASLNDVELLGRRVAAISLAGGLTEREREVLVLLADSYTAEAIAEHLHVSLATVRSHKKHIYTKLDVHKTEDLIRLIRNA